MTPSAFANALAAEIEANPAPIEGLTATQSRMVRLILAANGRTVTALQLGAACARDQMAPPFSNTVTAQMCHIRRRRPDLGAQIEIIRGMGYRRRG